MSDNNSSSSSIVSAIWTISFWVFLIGKAMGAKCFLAWSWWWILLSIVPVIGELFRHYGLLG